MAPARMWDCFRISRFPVDGQAREVSPEAQQAIQGRQQPTGAPVLVPPVASGERPTSTLVAPARTRMGSMADRRRYQPPSRRSSADPAAAAAAPWNLVRDARSDG